MASHADELARSLNQAGYRVTRPRLAVIETMARSRRSLSTDEILARARKLCPGVGLATVYRSLDMLEAVGAVQRVQIGGKRYATHCHDASLHYHLVCSRCHGVTEAAVGRSAASLRSAMSLNGFRPQPGAIEVVGVCRECSSQLSTAGSSRMADADR
jgi:Fur family ferric uptake transcriptional regulator